MQQEDIQSDSLRPYSLDIRVAGSYGRLHTLSIVILPTHAS